MIQGEAGCVKQVKAVDVLIGLAQRFDSSQEYKCCMSRAYADIMLCVLVDHKILEDIAEKIKFLNRKE